MIASVLRAGILCGISAFFFSCDRITPLPTAAPETPSLAPGRDELYVFPHGRLGMTAFEHLRTEFPGVSSTDLTRIAMRAQWALTRVPAGKTATLQETTRCVRALFPPAPARSAIVEAERFATERLGFASLALLRQTADDAAVGWSIDWNPSLVREYGISLPRHE